jgi:phosphoglycolate phosphatase
MDTMPRALRALFFDFDGVIVDSIQTKTEAFRFLFKGYPDEVVRKVLDYHRQHGGISRVDKIALAHEEYIGSALGKADLKVWSDRYSELVVEKVIEVPWIKGAIEFLDSTCDSDVHVFVISGTPEPELKYIIDKRGLSDYFLESLGSPTRKPAHIRRLLEQYKLQPDEGVFIGDALTDYDAANETGLHFVGIQGEIQFPAGTVVLDDCLELQGAIDNIFISKSQ